MLAEFHPFALSLMLGLLIGAEREYHHKKSATAFGVRTFPFISLAGTLAAYIGILPLTLVIASAVFTLIAFSYFKTAAPNGKDADFGLTTEFAALIVFCTGYILAQNPRTGTVIGLATFTLLISRAWLHNFIRHKLRQNEINAAAMLIVAVFGVAPFLPDDTVDLFGLFNPRQFVTLLSLIGLIHFAGYAAIRVFGARAGLALTGFMGGFISSTAVFLQIREMLRGNADHQKTVMATGLLAVTATLTELMAVVFVASPRLSGTLWLPLTAMAASALAVAAILLWTDSAKVRGSEAGEPMNFKAILKLGLLLSLLIAGVELAHRIFSAAGLWIIVFSSGLFEMHGAALAVSVDHAKGNISDETARYAVLIAVGASFVSKIGIIAARKRDGFALKLSVALIFVMLSGAATVAF